MSLEGFDLEFDVDLDASVGETRVFGAVAPADFIFAVGSVWARHNTSRYLVSGEFNSGNLIEWLKNAARRFSSVPPLPTELIAATRSHVCHWFLRYWDWINAETADETDEAAYDRLFPYCILAEDNGCIAVFSAAGTAFIQVCAQEATVAQPICFEARLRGMLEASRIEDLRAQIEGDVRTHSTRH